MPFEPDLRIGQVIDNERLTREFGCSPQGGMRRSRKTSTLVLISNHTGQGIYVDKKVGNTLHYSGMGMSGDQEISFMQNKTLSESKTNGVDLHFFEVFKEHQYSYLGKVELDGDPYKEIQEGEDGVPRRVWMFPLRVASYENPLSIVEEDIITSAFKKRGRLASRQSDQNLKDNAIKSGSTLVGNRKTISLTYIRNPYVTEHAKRRAKGRCQLCDNDAPFNSSDGNPYLETHHIKWLSEAGADTIDNTVALCPNCHRKMHALNKSEDKKKLVGIARG